MSYSPLIKQLIDALCCLPVVGPKSAQRMALQLLESKREAGFQLAQSIQEALENVGRCSQCRIFSEDVLCHICRSTRRNKHLICVVENPSDVFAIEASDEFNGNYFVLSGHLSPIDGIGPEEIGIVKLLEIVTEHAIEEIILATGTTVEGEATAFYLSEQLANFDNLKVTRIAYGVPMGGELEFIDSHTIARALTTRAELI